MTAKLMHVFAGELAASAIVAVLLTGGCAAADPSKVAFVREVYESEVTSFAQHRIAAKFDMLLSVSTQELLAAAKAGPGPKTEGPILHALFGWRVFPNMRVELKRVEPTHGFMQHDTVTVEIDVNGTPRAIAVSVSENCDAGTATVRYCIDDFRYSEGLSYREHLKSLAAH